MSDNDIVPKSVSEKLMTDEEDPKISVLDFLNRRAQQNAAAKPQDKSPLADVPLPPPPPATPVKRNTAQVAPAIGTTDEASDSADSVEEAETVITEQYTEQVEQQMNGEAQKQADPDIPAVPVDAVDTGRFAGSQKQRDEQFANNFAANIRNRALRTYFRDYVINGRELIDEITVPIARTRYLDGRIEYSVWDENCNDGDFHAIITPVGLTECDNDRWDIRPLVPFVLRKTNAGGKIRRSVCLPLDPNADLGFIVDVGGIVRDQTRRSFGLYRIPRDEWDGARVAEPIKILKVTSQYMREQIEIRATVSHMSSYPGFIGVPRVQGILSKVIGRSSKRAPDTIPFEEGPVLCCQYAPYRYCERDFRDAIADKEFVATLQDVDNTLNMWTEATKTLRAYCQEHPLAPHQVPLVYAATNYYPERSLVVVFALAVIYSTRDRTSEGHRLFYGRCYWKTIPDDNGGVISIPLPDAYSEYGADAPDRRAEYRVGYEDNIPEKLSGTVDTFRLVVI